MCYNQCIFKYNKKNDILQQGEWLQNDENFKD